MFLRIQDFDFVQIESILPKSNQSCPNLISFVQKSTLDPQLLRQWDHVTWCVGGGGGVSIW